MYALYVCISDSNSITAINNTCTHHWECIMVIISVTTHMQMEESHTQIAQIQYQGIHPQSDHAAGNFLK